MIVANETVATHICNLELPFVYRIHGEPRTEKIEDFLKLVKMMGYSVDVNINEISPKAMQGILNSLKEKKGFEIFKNKTISKEKELRKNT